MDKIWFGSIFVMDDLVGDLEPLITTLKCLNQLEAYLGISSNLNTA